MMASIVRWLQRPSRSRSLLIFVAAVFLSLERVRIGIIK
jgi:hypothetical protein